MTLLLPTLFVGFLVATGYAADSDRNAQLAPEIAASLDLRKYWQAALPQCTASVYVHSAGVHHTKTDQSIIACRDNRGAWTVSKVVQDGPGGLLQTERKLTSKSERKMTGAEGKQLDAIIGLRSLNQEKVQRTGETGVGAPSHVMQIVSPEGNAVARWNGKLLGHLGRIADIVLGPG